MAAPLLYAVNSLNQKVADTFSSSYIQWNSKENFWFVQKNGFGKPFEWMNWHRLRILAYILWYAITGIYSLTIWVNYPGILDVQDVALVALVGFSVMPLVLLLEYGYMKYAAEYCGYDNWGNDKLEELAVHKPMKTLNPKLLQTLKEECTKMYRGDKKNVDWWGMAALNVFVGLYPSSFTLPTILTFADMDLSYIWLYTLSSPKLLGLPALYNNFIGKLFRSLIQGLMFQSSAITISTCVLLVANNFQASLEIISYLKNMPVVNQNVLYLYREFYLGQYLVGPLYKLCNTLFLSSAFVVLLFSVNLTLLGYSHLPFKMHIVAPIIFVYMMGMVLAVLLVEGYVYYETYELLSSWKWPTGRGRSAVVKKMLISCRPITFPCGDIGIVDRDIKINYLLSVLDRSIEVLLLFKV